MQETNSYVMQNIVNTFSIQYEQTQYMYMLYAYEHCADIYCVYDQHDTACSSLQVYPEYGILWTQSCRTPHLLFPSF